MTPLGKLLLGLLAAVGLAGAGAYGYKEHLARLDAEGRLKRWQDSTTVAVARADSAERAFRIQDSIYSHLPPKVIDHWHAVASGGLDTLLVHDPADSALIKRIRASDDSVLKAVAHRDSVADSTVAAARHALAEKDAALALALHPPPAPKLPRFAFVGTGAYDPIAHGFAVGLRAETHLGQVEPFVALGATIAQATTGQVLLGVQYRF